MGTPTAPLYSFLTFGIHENLNILNSFKANLIYYKHFIENVFGVWIHSTDNPWVQFKPP